MIGDKEGEKMFNKCEREGKKNENEGEEEEEGELDR